jgi:hypothetical protein
MDDNLTTQLHTLATLLTHAATLAAPFDAQLKALEIARADALASVQWEIDNLKTVIRPLILAARRSVKTEGLTVGYVHKETWDDSLLRTFAQEMPTLLQCLKDASYVTFRHRPLRGEHP